MNKHQHIIYKLSLSLFLAMAMAWIVPVQASHIIGAEIRYQCIDAAANRYKVILDVYRDCFYGEAGFDDPVYVNVFDENGVYLEDPNIRLEPLIIETLDNNISADPCLLPPEDVCVERAYYEGEFTIDTPGGFYLVYQRCCRNMTISNIEIPDSTGSTYYTYITPESRAICNSSPEFDFYPPIFVCVGKAIEHPHAARDTFRQENDSLVYRFYTPFTGATIEAPNPGPGYASEPPYDTVVWIDPPYNLEAILGPSSVAELSIDPHTGLITGFPQIQGQFVVGVLVEEYRNGVLLSVTRRDFQYNVGECVQVDAEIDANNVQCDDLTVNFGNNTNGPDNFLWYYIEGLDTVFFSDEFEPSFTFPDTGKYEIMLVAEPGWDCVDTTYAPLFLQFNSLNADFSWQTFDCTEESVLLLEDLSADPVSPPAEWFWEVIVENDTLTSTAQDTVFTVPNPSNGTINLTVRSLNGCEQVKTVDFETGLNDPSDFLPDLIEICIGESTELNPNGLTNGFTYQWAPPVPSGQRTLANPTVTPSQPATYNYAVTITGYDDLCISVDTVVVNVYPEVSLDFEPDTDCDARVVHFINNSLNAPAGYVWNFGDPNVVTDISTLPAPTYIYPDYGTYSITLITGPGAVCADTITRDIVLEEKILEADFDFDFVQCEDGEVAVSFFDVSINNQFNTDNWLWEFSGVYNGTSQSSSPTIAIDQEGELIVKLTIITEEDCVDETVATSLNIDLTELPCLVDGEVQGCLEEGVTLNACGDPNYSYQWFPVEGLSCVDCPNPFANPAQTTTYTVMVENISADTCFITRQVTVVVPDDVGLVTSGDVLTCDTSATLIASTTLVPVEYNWFNENGVLLSAGANSLSVDVSGYNNYIVRATDEFNCHYFDTVQVVGGPPDIQAIGDQAICSDDPLNVFAVNSDSNDTLTWQWTPASAFEPGTTTTSNPDFIIVPGNQTLTVTATNQFGCDTATAVEIDVLDVNNELDFDFEIECNGSEVSFFNLSTGAYNYLWDFGDPTTTNDVSTLENPTYTYPSEDTFNVILTLDFPLDCFEPIEKEVIISQTQFTVDIDFAYVDCSEDSVSIQFFNATTFNINNITIDSFYWELSNGMTSNEENPIFPLTTGDDLGVTLTIWTSNGCLGSDNEFIKFEFPNIPLADSLVLCPGDSVFLNPTGDVSFVYDWFPNVAIDSTSAVNPQVWPSQTTTYSVMVTSFIPDTCSIIKEVTVFVPPVIDVVATGDTLTCGDPITLMATSPVDEIEYEWTAFPPNGTVGTGDVLTHYPQVDTRYELLATDQYGCTDTTSYFVINEVMDVDIPNGGDTCPEDEIMLEATNNIDEHIIGYQWFASDPAYVFEPDTNAAVMILTPPAGEIIVYSVAIENQHGCLDTLSLALDGYLFEPGIAPNDTICIGTPTELNPGADSSLNYIWSPVLGFDSLSPNPTAVLTGSTDFTIIVSTSFGLDECADTVEVTRFVPEPIEITGLVDTFTCGNAIELNTETNVATSLIWLDENGDTVHLGNSFMPNPSTGETFTALATDEFGCSMASLVDVFNRALSLSLDGEGVIDTCPQESYNICIENLNPNDTLSYEWISLSNGEILGDNTSPCVDVTAAQGETSSFSVFVTNQWGCTEEDTAAITTYVFVPTFREFVTICPDVPTPINEGADSLLNYTWTPALGLDCDTCANPVATLSQTQQYLVTISGANAEETCVDSGSVNVIVNPYIELSTTPSPDTTLCDTTDVTLSASVISPIVEEICWYEGSSNTQLECADEITVMPEHGSFEYFAVARDTSGCFDTTSVTVNAFGIDVTLDGDSIFCEEDQVHLIEVFNNDSINQILTFCNWTGQQFIVDAAGDSSSIVVDDIPDEQEFSVLIKNQYECSSTVSTTVYYYDVEPLLGDITSTMDTIYFNSGEFSQLDLTFFDPDLLFEWVPADGLSPDEFVHNPEAAPLETTEYVLIATNEQGCSAERMVLIEVLNPDCAEPNIFVPNAFTPNGDGNNDVLFVRSNIIENMELSIYNRWGELVFRTNDQGTGWDGTYKGKRLSPDVFGYYLRADCFNGMEFTKKGNVTILR
ncbi:MAG: gliding motility-associated C-terminal domain-containing protein [Bacteroidota bacterium]